MRRLARAVGLLGMALGLVLTSVPAAHAAASLTVTFTDQASLTGCDGLGAPGTGTTDPTNPLAELCTFTIDALGQTCAYSEESIKNGKVPTAGLCSFTATGTVKGYCGLSKGEGTATINLLGTGQTYTVEFLFVGTGGTLTVTGTATKHTGGQTGPFEAVVEAAPPTPLLTPEGGSCTNSTATIFTIVGEGTATVA